MAKSRKTTESEKDQMLETPAGITAAPADRLTWHESTETRELPVELSQTEVIERACLMIDQHREAEALADQKKASADRFKALIEEKEAEIKISEDVVKTGKERAEVACRWIFEANGVDEIGAAIYHSDMKTLIREDNGQAVEVRPITNEDRQVSLPLEMGSMIDQVKVDLLAKEGWTVRETPEGTTDHDAPFEAVGAEDERRSIWADSLGEAIESAAAQLLDPAGESNPLD